MTQKQPPKQLVKGQEIYFAGSERYHQTGMTTVLRVGRVWAELSNGYRIDIDTFVADGHGCHSPGRGWLTKEAHDLHKLREGAWSKIRQHMSLYYSPPAALNLDEIMQIQTLLGISFSAHSFGAYEIMTLTEARIMRDKSWDQYALAKWQEDTFGPLSSNLRGASRANEEMAELITELVVDDNSAKAAAEIADIVIVLAGVATRLGIDIQTEIDKKMAINVGRTWKRKGDGTGYHIKAPA